MSAEHTAAYAVRKGIKVLDDNYSRWWMEINLNKFVMCSCHDCLLGQLFGEYNEGMIALFGTRMGGWQFGFDGKEWEQGKVKMHPKINFDRLRKIWYKVIAERQRVTKLLAEVDMLPEGVLPPEERPFRDSKLRTLIQNVRAKYCQSMPVSVTVDAMEGDDYHVTIRAWEGKDLFLALSYKYSKFKGDFVLV